jgi:hypothetical protein
MTLDDIDRQIQSGAAPWLPTDSAIVPACTSPQYISQHCCSAWFGSRRRVNSGMRRSKPRRMPRANYQSLGVSSVSRLQRVVAVHSRSAVLHF